MEIETIIIIICICNNKSEKTFRMALQVVAYVYLYRLVDRAVSKLTSYKFRLVNFKCFCFYFKTHQNTISVGT